MPSVVYTPNFWTGRVNGPPIAVVIHTMAGSRAGCDSWFAQPVSRVSAHYGVGLDGDFSRYVRRWDSAWANGALEHGNVWPGPLHINPNWLTVSIETEDLNDPQQEVTPVQYNTVRTLIRTVHEEYDSILYLLGHCSISPRSKPDCPGDRWITSWRLADLAADTGLELRLP